MTTTQDFLRKARAIRAKEHVYAFSMDLVRPTRSSQHWQDEYNTYVYFKGRDGRHRRPRIMFAHVLAALFSAAGHPWAHPKVPDRRHQTRRSAIFPWLAAKSGHLEPEEALRMLPHICQGFTVPQAFGP